MTTTECDPQWADLFPTDSGRRALQAHGLPASGTDLLAWPEQHDLLIGESSEHLFEVAAEEVHAVRWRTSEDHTDYDHAAVALGLPLDAFVMRPIKLWFDLSAVGLQGLDLRDEHPAQWHADWLHVQGTRDCMMSFPRDWVDTT